MKRINGSSWVLIVVAWGLGSSGAPAMGAQEVVLPEPIRKALARFEELKTLSITWNQHTRVGAQTRGLKYVYDLEWQAGKMHVLREDGGRKKDNPKAERNEFAFDGQMIEVARPDASTAGLLESPVLIINPAEDEQPESDYFGANDFDRSGIRFPHGAGELLRVRHLVSQILFLLEHGGRLEAVGRTQIDGRPMTRIDVLAENPDWPQCQKADFVKFEDTLRSFGSLSEQEIKGKVALYKRQIEATPRELKYVYYLDPELAYAVRRFQELSKGGQLRVQSDCTEHQELPGHEIWLARNCLTNYYVSESPIPGTVFDSPVQTLVREVSEFGTKPISDEQFTLRSRYTTAGTFITDNRLPENKKNKGSVTYRLPANSADLDRVIEEARGLSATIAGKQNARSVFKIVLLTANIVAPFALLLYFMIRLRRKVIRS